VSIESTEWQESGSGKMTPAQQRLLNSACGDLAEQVSWHGNRLSKDDFRHMVAAAVLGTWLRPRPTPRKRSNERATETRTRARHRQRSP
jgi:hypothetical protein